MALQKRLSRGSVHLSPRMRRVLARAGALGVSLVLALAIVEPNLAFREGAAFCGLYAVARWYYGFNFRRSDYIVVALGVWATISVLWTPDVSSSVNSAMNFIACTAIYLGTRCAASQARYARWACAGVAVGGVVAVSLIFATHGFRLRVLPEGAAESFGYEGVNVNFTGYALATAIVAVIAWSSLATRKTIWRLLLFTALLLTMYVGVMLTGARGAVMSVACMFLWWLIWRLVSGRWPRWTYRLLALACAGVALALTFGLVDERIRASLTPSVKETGDLNGRLTIWPIARDLWSENPLVGHGVGSLPHLIDGKILRLVGEELTPQPGINAHTAFLDLGVGLGAVGALLFAAAVLVPLRPGPKASQRSSPFLSGMFLSASLPILLFGFWIESPVFWGTLGLVVSVGSIVSRHDADSGRLGYWAPVRAIREASRRRQPSAAVDPSTSPNPA